MGLFNKVCRLLAWMRRNPSLLPVVSKPRICRFEPVENRELLSANPVHVGVVTSEPSDPQDQTGNTVWIQFTGGAAGTQLTQLVFNTSADPTKPLADGAVFIQTQAGPPGYSGFVDPSVVSVSGGATATIEPIANGAQQFIVDFKNFTAGDVAVLKLDFDEWRQFSNGTGSANPFTEGKEIQDSLAHFDATFTAPHYERYQTTDVSDITSPQYNYFLDQYNYELTNTNLTIPPSGVETGSCGSDATAGAVVTFCQTPLPTISGTVFVDTPSQPPVEGALVTLYQELPDGSRGKQVDQTTTDSNGNYIFYEEPGTYQVVETQPSDYVFSSGSWIGTVNGKDDGKVVDDHTLVDIKLNSCDNSVQNDFAVANPVTLSGYVYYDANNNGVMDLGEHGIRGATITLVYTPDSGRPGQANIQLTTDANGYWTSTAQSTPLRPGEYTVKEVQPAAYFDGTDAAGDVTTVDGVTTKNVGTPQNPLADEIDNVCLCYSGDAGTQYDFGELKGTISGHVWLDTNYDQQFQTTTETLPANVNVTMTLIDTTTNQVVGTTTVNAQGFYEFQGVGPGLYKVMRGTVGNTGDYLDWYDKAGSVGATQDGTASSLTTIGGIDMSNAMTQYRDGVNYDFAVIQPATISGHVWASQDNVGDHAAGDQGIGGVTITLYKKDPTDANWVQVGQTTTSTAANNLGYYQFTGVMTGPDTLFKVDENQATVPADYFDGLSLVGTINGTTHGDNTDPSTGLTDVDNIYDVDLRQTQAGINYDFTEIQAVSISGYVFQHGSNPITYDPTTGPPDIYTIGGSSPTAGDNTILPVTLELADGSGEPILDTQGNIITTTTNSQGYYQFAGLMPGLYTVIQMPISGYTDATDTPGATAGVKAEWVNIHQTNLTETQLLSLYELTAYPPGDAIAHINAQKPGQNVPDNNFSVVQLQAVPPTTPPTTPNSPNSWSPAPLTPVVQPNIVPLGEGLVVPAGLYSLPEPVVSAVFLGGGGFAVGSTWHVATLDGGQARGLTDGSNTSDLQTGAFYAVQAWSGEDLHQAQWILANREGVPTQEYVFGTSGSWPVTGDWSGDGRTKIGVYHDGQWFLDLDGDGKWGDGDLWARLGLSGDKPVTGDWDGDGKTDIAIFGADWAHDNGQLIHDPGLPSPLNPPKNVFKNIPPANAAGEVLSKRTSAGKVRADVIDHVFRFGSDSDIAVAGDWTGCGISSIGVFRKGVWYLDIDGDGRWSAADIMVQFGQAGDIPVVGDWTGDGVKKLGVYRKGTWYLDVTNCRVLDQRAKVIHLGGADDLPVVGDWNGDGVDKIGIYRPGKPADKGQGPSATPQARSVAAPTVTR